MRFTTIIASASVAAVMGLAGVSVAGATSNPGSAPAQPAATAAATATAPSGTAKAVVAKRHRAALRRRIRHGAARIVAKTIGITRPELRAELKSGKTIATIATDHGVQPQAVVDALKSAATKRIDAAQAAGRITAERAAKLKTRLDTAIPKLVNEWHPRQAAQG
jgi:protein involved in polysaccharide export with SLBB domain